MPKVCEILRFCLLCDLWPSGLLQFQSVLLMKGDCPFLAPLRQLFALRLSCQHYLSVTLHQKYQIPVKCNIDQSLKVQLQVRDKKIRLKTLEIVALWDISTDPHIICSFHSPSISF